MTAAAQEAPVHAPERIMMAAVRHAVFDGWTPRILAVGARDVGYAEDAADLAFPGGIPELIEAFSHWADARMLDALTRTDLTQLKGRDRVALAVRLRLEALAPHREAVRRLTAHCALPGNAALGARLIGETVSKIWYAAGDTATDFSYYTKRGLLAAVYSATILYWLADESEGSRETWAFLDRRLGDVLKIPKIRARLADAFARLPNPLKLRRLLRRH
jgi:ubiquinone biosynthesis protein COQ9